MRRMPHTHAYSAPSYAELELSAAAYDEIEKKLLAAGYDHLFARGPGSAIDMQGIAVTREPETKHPPAGQSRAPTHRRP